MHHISLMAHPRTDAFPRRAACRLYRRVENLQMMPYAAEFSQIRAGLAEKLIYLCRADHLSHLVMVHPRADSFRRRGAGGLHSRAEDICYMPYVSSSCQIGVGLREKLMYLCGPAFTTHGVVAQPRAGLFRKKAAGGPHRRLEDIGTIAYGTEFIKIGVGLTEKLMYLCGRALASCVVMSEHLSDGFRR
jgi:hypothetical protein